MCNIVETLASHAHELQRYLKNLMKPADGLNLEESQQQRDCRSKRLRLPNVSSTMLARRALTAQHP